MNESEHVQRAASLLELLLVNLNTCTHTTVRYVHMYTHTYVRTFVSTLCEDDRTVAHQGHLQPPIPHL